MNPEWKAKWVAALRSGNYQQGSGDLRHDDRFCCLGVLCDLVDPTKWDDIDRYEDADSYPPDDVLRIVGLEIADCHQLAHLNDGEWVASGHPLQDFEKYDEDEDHVRPQSFEEIANVIEAVL